MWINFARSGNPSTSKHIWEQYNSKTRKTMILDKNIKMEEDFKKEQSVLIEPLLKYYFNGCYSNLSLNVPQFYKIIAQIIGALLILIGIIVLIIVLIVKKVKKKKKNKENDEKNKENNENDENKEKNDNNDNDDKNEINEKIINKEYLKKDLLK